MTKTESYAQEYPKINKAYNTIFDSLQILIEAEDSDPEVCAAINNALVYLDPVLDKIKEERDKAIKNSSKKDDSSKGTFKVF